MSPEIIGPYEFTEGQLRVIGRYRATNTLKCSPEQVRNELEAHTNLLEALHMAGYSAANMTNMLRGAGNDLPQMLGALETRRRKLSDMIHNDYGLGDSDITNLLRDAYTDLGAAIDRVYAAFPKLLKRLSDSGLPPAQFSGLFYKSGVKIDDNIRAYDVYYPRALTRMMKQGTYSAGQLVGMIRGSGHALPQTLATLVNSDDTLQSLARCGTFEARDIGLLLHESRQSLEDSMKAWQEYMPRVGDYLEEGVLTKDQFVTLFMNTGNRARESLESFFKKKDIIKSYLEEGILNAETLVNALRRKKHGTTLDDQLQMLIDQKKQIAGHIRQLPFSPQELRVILDYQGKDIPSFLEWLAAHAQTLETLVARKGESWVGHRLQHIPPEALDARMQLITAEIRPPSADVTGGWSAEFERGCWRLL